MIVDHPSSHFIFIFHPLTLVGKKYTIYNGREMTNAEVLRYWGKWIVLGDRRHMDDLARQLDPFVENGTIPCIKYDRTPSVNLDIEECVMMVYCDRRNREEVWRILSGLEVKLKAWVTERETMEMWLPGGRMLEKWLASKGFDEMVSNAIRQEANDRLMYIFEHPDERFEPWQQ